MYKPTLPPGGTLPSLERLKRAGPSRGPSREPSPASTRGDDATADWKVELGAKPDGAGANWEKSRRKRILEHYKAGKEWAKALVTEA